MRGEGGACPLTGVGGARLERGVGGGGGQGARAEHEVAACDDVGRRSRGRGGGIGDGADAGSTNFKMRKREI